MRRNTPRKLDGFDRHNTVRLRHHGAVVPEVYDELLEIPHTIVAIDGATDGRILCDSVGVHAQIHAWKYPGAYRGTSGGIGRKGYISHLRAPGWELLDTDG